MERWIPLNHKRRRWTIQRVLFEMLQLQQPLLFLRRRRRRNTKGTFSKRRSGSDFKIPTLANRCYWTYGFGLHCGEVTATDDDTLTMHIPEICCLCCCWEPCPLDNCFNPICYDPLDYHRVGNSNMFEYSGRGVKLKIEFEKALGNMHSATLHQYFYKPITTNSFPAIRCCGNNCCCMQVSGCLRRLQRKYSDWYDRRMASDKVYICCCCTM